MIKPAWSEKRILKYVLASIESLPTKELIYGQYFNDIGGCCAIGACFKPRSKKLLEGFKNFGDVSMESSINFNFLTYGESIQKLLPFLLNKEALRILTRIQVVNDEGSLTKCLDDVRFRAVKAYLENRISFLSVSSKDKT